MDLWGVFGGVGPRHSVDHIEVTPNVAQDDQWQAPFFGGNDPRQDLVRLPFAIASAPPFGRWTEVIPIAGDVIPIDHAVRTGDASRLTNEAMATAKAWGAKLGSCRGTTVSDEIRRQAVEARQGKGKSERRKSARRSRWPRWRPRPEIISQDSALAADIGGPWLPMDAPRLNRGYLWEVDRILKSNPCVPS